MGSEMCIRDRDESHRAKERSSQQTEVAIMLGRRIPNRYILTGTCLLYTSDAADERSSVDLGGRRIIKKKKDTDEREVTVNKT